MISKRNNDQAQSESQPAQTPAEKQEELRKIRRLQLMIDQNPASSIDDRYGVFSALPGPESDLA